MFAAQILHTIGKFYTTEVQLKHPYFENDWANYALSYLQHFTGKVVILSQDGKIERVDPKAAEEKFPWIPSAIKTVAYFFLIVPFAIIGTIARLLSLDSTEVTEAIFSERCPPPRREPAEPAMAKVHRSAFNLTYTRKGRKISFQLPEEGAELPPTPSLEQKTDNAAWNALLQSGEGLTGETAAFYQEIRAMGLEKYKLQKQTEASQMLGLLISFNKKLLEQAQKPGTSTPNYAAVAAFIEEQKRDTQSYCFPFFLRDNLIMALPTMAQLGVKLNSQDLTQWEELDAQCQVLMNTRELKAYLNEELPNEIQNQLTANQRALRSQALPLKTQVQDTMKNHSEFFRQLLRQLEKKPQDRSAILSLLNAKGDNSSLGSEAFTHARLCKAESGVLKNFYDEPLFSNYIELYTSCFVQLHAAKFSIPSTANPLSRDLLEGTAPAEPVPAPAATAAGPAMGSNLQNSDMVALLLRSAISFSEELLEQKSVAEKKAFLENSRKATATYKSPFNVRLYTIFVCALILRHERSFESSRCCSLENM
jgi:Arc/MetJ-type ribon-helix-helix transcriptional regulator